MYKFFKRNRQQVVSRRVYPRSFQLTYLVLSDTPLSHILSEYIPTLVNTDNKLIIQILNR